MDSLKDVYTDRLQDLCSANTQAVAVIRELAEATVSDSFEMPSNLASWESRMAAASLKPCCARMIETCVALFAKAWRDWSGKRRRRDWKRS